MDLSAINPILFLASLMVAATPILLAGIGELVAERAGVLNLGVEGMMITGAVCGFIIAVNTGSACYSLTCSSLVLTPASASWKVLLLRLPILST